MKSVFYKRILLPTQDLTASVSSQPTTPTPTNPVAVSYTICGNYKLYGLTNYLDTFNATTKVITHKIGIKVLDGTENWQSYRYQSNYYAYYIIIDNMFDTSSSTASNNFLNTHFEYVSTIWGNDGIGYAVSTMKRMFFRRNTTDTIDTFKSYLAQQYAAGTPVIIYYPLATETTETATEPLQRVETKSFVQYKANPEYRNLPAGYTQVKYLQSSGIGGSNGQWIDTGFTYDTSKLPIEIDIKINYPVLTKGVLFGLQNSSRSNWFYPVYSPEPNSSKVISYFGNVKSSTFFTRVTNTDYIIHIEANNTNFIRKVNNGEPIENIWNSSSVDTYAHLLLFAGSYGTKVDDAITAKIYYFSIKENNQLVRDLVPCYNSNNVAGMYDLVNNVFYQNSGTGTFIVGEDVPQFIRVDEKGFAMYQLNPNWHDLPSGYTELEYLESSGTQYIDTGYNVSSDNIKVEVGFDGSSTYKNAWGFVANVGDTGWFTPYGGYNSGYGFYCGTSGNLGQYYFTVGVKTDSVYETNNGTITITRNGTQVLSQAYTGSFTSDAHGNFMLFTQGGASQSSRLSSSYIWYLRLYENNTLVRNLIPARNSNNILGMYDKSWDNTKCGVVDLGTLTWNYVSPTSSAPNGYFVCYNVPQKASSSTNQYLNGYKNGANPSVDKSIWGNNSLSLLCITDFRYTTAEDFKQAMSGKLLYYQRTTDTTYQPPFYTNAGTGTFIAGNVVPKYIKHGG